MAIQRQNFTWPQTSQGEGLSWSLRGLCIEEHIQYWWNTTGNSTSFTCPVFCLIWKTARLEKPTDRRRGPATGRISSGWGRISAQLETLKWLIWTKVIPKKRPDFHWTGKQCAHARTPWLLTNIYDPRLCCFVLHLSYSNWNSNHNGSVKMFAPWPSQL